MSEHSAYPLFKQPPKKPDVPKSLNYTALNWQELISQARENANRHRSQPPVLLETQSHAPIALSEPTASQQSTEVLEGHPSLSPKLRSGLPRRSQLKCDPSSNDPVLRGSKQSISQTWARWGRITRKLLSNPHTDQATLDFLAKSRVPDSPANLYALGECSVQSPSISHPSGYTFRSLPSREVGPPGTLAQVRALEAAFRKARCKEAKSKAIEMPVHPALGQSVHTPLGNSGYSELHDSTPTQSLPDQACAFDRVQSPTPAGPSQREGFNSSVYPMFRHHSEPTLTPTSIAIKKNGEIANRNYLDFLTKLNSTGYTAGVTRVVTDLEPSTSQDPSTQQAQVPEQTIPISDSHQCHALPTTPAMSMRTDECDASNVSGTKRKASEEPETAPLSKQQRKRQNKRAKKAAAEDANRLIEAVERTAGATIAEPVSKDAGSKIISSDPTLTLLAEAIQWDLLCGGDQGRLLKLGYVPPLKPEPPMSESKRSRREKLEKRRKLDKPEEHQMPDTKGTAAALEEYQRQREGRRDVEELIEETFAETQEDYIKVEGKDGEPQYMAWKNVKKMDLGWMLEV